jgi:hypothetical protein
MHSLVEQHARCLVALQRHYLYVRLCMQLIWSLRTESNQKNILQSASFLIQINYDPMSFSWKLGMVCWVRVCDSDQISSFR